MHKKVLMVAYAFPPVGGAGVQRVVKFVKYLRGFNWEPLVLTVSNPSVPVMDNALLKDIPDKVKIFFARSLEPSYAQKQVWAQPSHGKGNSIKLLLRKILSGFLLPDVQVLWWPGLIGSLIRIIRREKPDCIFVTGPPFSSFLPVVAIGALFGVPVVVDYRDEWSFSREQWENAVQGKVARALDIVFEKYVVSQCTAITAATQSYINTLERHHRLCPGKGTAVTNGFDVDDFLITSKDEAPGNNEKTTIVYSGTVWRATSLQCFTAALQGCLAIDKNFESDVRFKLFGRVVESESSYLIAEDLRNMIDTFGYIQHAMLINELMNADVLLLVLSDLPGADKIIPAKTFEYMATGKHIFAIIPDGETKALLSEHYGNVTFANPRDLVDIRDKLLGMIRNIDEIKSIKGKDVSQFSRERLTGKLVEIFNGVT